jgi:hypothetical protein
LIENNLNTFFGVENLLKKLVKTLSLGPIQTEPYINDAWKLFNVDAFAITSAVFGKKNLKVKTNFAVVLPFRPTSQQRLK